jgi:hypothetical protein
MRAKADINKPVGQVRSHFESRLGFAFACRLLGSIPSFGMVTLDKTARRGQPSGKSGCGPAG